MIDMLCPKCGSSAVKNGFKVTKRGKIQRYQCEQGHIFMGEHLPIELR